MKTSVFTDIVKIFLVAIRIVPIITILLMSISLLLGFLPLVSLLLIENILNIVLDSNEMTLKTAFIIGLWGFISFFEQILGEMRVYMSMIVQVNVKKYLSNMLIDKIMKYSTERFEEVAFQNLIDRSRHIINSGMLWEYTLSIFYLPINIIIIITIISYITGGSILGLLLMFSFIILQLVWLYMSKREERENSIKLENMINQKNYYYSVFWRRNENRDIRIFDLRNFFKIKWIKTTWLIYQKEKRVRIKYLFLFFLLFKLLCFSLLFSIQIDDFIYNPHMIVPTLIGFVFFIDAVTSFSDDISDILSSENYLKDFFVLIKDNNKTTSYLEEPSSKLNDEIFMSLQNVGFQYPGEENKVLKNININLKNEEIVAIVGENGAGKTTLVKIILGLYEPTEGKVKTCTDSNTLRKHISAEFQDFIRYEYNISENVGLGDDDLYYSTDAIERAFHKSDLDVITNNLPLKMQQQLGKQFQGGIDLSGGQWQKVGLARACLRDSLLISLDEPTANLDPNEEAKMFKLFVKNHNKNILILVAHRIGPAKMADRILVLHGGEIVEQGSHEELIALGKRYYNLYNTQAKWYI